MGTRATRPPRAKMGANLRGDLPNAINYSNPLHHVGKVHCKVPSGRDGRTRHSAVSRPRRALSRTHSNPYCKIRAGHLTTSPTLLWSLLSSEKGSPTEGEWASRGASERGRFVVRRMLVLIVSVVCVMSMAASAALADTWSGVRTCTVSSEQCRSTSSTYGTPGTFPSNYTVHTHNGVRSTEWPLTASPTTRAFTSQTGSVDVFLYTTGVLQSGGASCVCVNPPCPV